MARSFSLRKERRYLVRWRVKGLRCSWLTRSGKDFQERKYFEPWAKHFWEDVVIVILHCEKNGHLSAQKISLGNVAEGILRVGAVAGGTGSQQIGRSDLWFRLLDYKHSCCGPTFLFSSRLVHNHLPEECCAFCFQTLYWKLQSIQKFDFTTLRLIARSRELKDFEFWRGGTGCLERRAILWTSISPWKGFTKYVKLQWPGVYWGIKKQ